MNLKNVNRDPVCSQKRSVIYSIHIPVLFLLLLFYDKVHPGSVETPELSVAELCLLQWLIKEGGKKFPSIPCLGVHFCWRLECCSLGHRAGDNFSRAQQHQGSQQEHFEAAQKCFQQHKPLLAGTSCLVPETLCNGKQACVSQRAAGGHCPKFLLGFTRIWWSY